MLRFAPTLILLIAGVGCSEVLGADFDRNAPAAADGDAGPGASPSAVVSPPAEVPAREDASTQPQVNDGGGGIPGDAGIAARDASNVEASCTTCGLPKPSNGAAFGALPAAGATPPTLPTEATFNTSLDCAAGSMLGDCAAASQAVGPEACVCRAAALSIKDLRVKGTRALVLLVHDTVSIAGTLDLAAEGTTGGPGAEPETASAQNAVFDYGNDALIPLRGGENGSPTSTSGGGGGGALQITAGTSITITAAGRIQAGGGGGSGAEYDGAAGGTGGAVLIEAPLVKVDGEILANGGGGGGGGDHDGYIGYAGSDARAAGRAAAPGGQGRDNQGCALRGYTSGGDGGYGATRTSTNVAGQGADTRVCIPARYVAAGGRGGGVGRVRVNTASSNMSLVVGAAAHVSPEASWGVLAY